MTYHHTTVVPADLAEARNIMARPDLYDIDTIADACCTARRVSTDWVDHVRADQLLSALRIEAAERLERAEVDARLRRQAAIATGIVGLGVWLAIILWGPTLVASAIRWAAQLAWGV